MYGRDEKRSVVCVVAVAVEDIPLLCCVVLFCFVLVGVDVF